MHGVLACTCLANRDQGHVFLRKHGLDIRNAAVSLRQTNNSIRFLILNGSRRTTLMKAADSAQSKSRSIRPLTNHFAGWLLQAYISYHRIIVWKQIYISPHALPQQLYRLRSALPPKCTSLGKPFKTLLCPANFTWARIALRRAGELDSL